MARGLANFDPDALRRHRLAATKPDGSGKAMSAADLAQMVGTTKAQILAYEQGRQVPEPGRIRQLAGALGTHPVELARGSSYEFASLADLRRSCGLPAREMVALLGLAPKTYRRFEAQGIVPPRRPALVDEVAAILQVPVSEVEVTLLHSPLVQVRVEQMGRLLDQMRAFHVEGAHPWRGPRAEDADVTQLAALMGRSSSSTARVLHLLLGNLRRQYLRVQLGAVTSTFEMDPTRRKKAQIQSGYASAQYALESSRLAPVIDVFFRQALPSDNWHTLVRLMTAGQWAPLTRLGLITSDLAALPARYVQERISPFSRETEYMPSEQARAHTRAFGSWYRALHPSVDVGDLLRQRRTKAVLLPPDRI